MPRPRKGARLGGSPSHERKLLANLATDLFMNEKVTTTLPRAKAVRPLAEKLITKARKGDLHSKRTVLRTIRSREAVVQAVRRRRPPLRGPSRWLHPDHQARPPSW